MSVFGDIIKPFWLQGLNEISGRPIKEIGGWICDEEYQVYDPPYAEGFTVNVDRPAPLLEAYAAEITRTAVAAFETVTALTRSRNFPKSTGWLIIKTYYATFFAAHAFLRILGRSCSPLEREHVRSITAVAEAYGNKPSAPIVGGLYALTFQTSASRLEGLRMNSLRAGAHEAFWIFFLEQIQKLSSDALQTSAGTLLDRQIVSTQLSDLASNLCFGSSGKGRWLSSVRNTVNYQHALSTWYPYGRPDNYYDQLFNKASEWKEDPEMLDLAAQSAMDLRRFQVTCNFIIAMLRVSIAEMARRCSAGKSFQNYSAMAFLNLLEQKARS